MMAKNVRWLLATPRRIKSGIRWSSCLRTILPTLLIFLEAKIRLYVTLSSAHDVRRNKKRQRAESILKPLSVQVFTFALKLFPNFTRTRMQNSFETDIQASPFSPFHHVIRPHLFQHCPLHISVHPTQEPAPSISPSVSHRFRLSHLNQSG